MNAEFHDDKLTGLTLEAADGRRWAFVPSAVREAHRRAFRSGQALFLSDILFECPACDHSMVVGCHAACRVIRCHRCQQRLIVPPVTVRMLLDGWQPRDGFPNVIQNPREFYEPTTMRPKGGDANE